MDEMDIKIIKQDLIVAKMYYSEENETLGLVEWSINYGEELLDEIERLQKELQACLENLNLEIDLAT